MAAATGPSGDRVPSLSDRKYPYIERLKQLQHAHPALKSFVKNVQNHEDEGRKVVQKEYLDRFGRLPGRCTLLTFNEAHVTTQEFLQPEQLDEYLTRFPALASNESDKDRCRLWILEDLEPVWMDILGQRLGVDPRVFSEQASTWNFTDAKTVTTRLPPSMVKPEKFFTLRYYEFRRVEDVDAIDSMRNQMTFAVNRRRYERWRDVDTKNFKNKWRSAFVRRCASFWTNQSSTRKGWDAVILVDPAFDSVEYRGPLTPPPSPSPPEAKDNDEISKPKKVIPGCLILADLKRYDNVKDLYDARNVQDEVHLQPKRDTTKPYHKGSTTLAEPSLHVQEKNRETQSLQEDATRNLSSPMDEIVYHWTKLADQDLITSARQQSVNAAHYLLKYLATLWMHQLDLVAFGIVQTQYFADDHEANINAETTRHDFKEELKVITETTKDMNYMKRQINHFERAMTLNLERLGIVLGAEAIGDKVPQAIKDAQMDFIAIRARLQPFCERVDGLSSMANDLANLHMAFKSIKDSEFSLRLSLLGSIVFPATLVASLLSMGDGYRAGQSQFWVSTILET